jgi:hypothetical protein
MKLIITESQKEKVLRDLIKNNGVKFASNMVGGIENLFDVLNIKSPMDFLHLFDDLEQVQSEQREDLILFRYKPNYNLMIYVTKNETVYIDYDEIWSFLEDKFGLSYEETRAFTKKWLDNVYNFRGITTNQFQDAYHSRIG